MHACTHACMHACVCTPLSYVCALHTSMRLYVCMDLKQVPTGPQQATAARCLATQPSVSRAGPRRARAEFTRGDHLCRGPKDLRAVLFWVYNDRGPKGSCSLVLMRQKTREIPEAMVCRVLTCLCCLLGPSYNWRSRVLPSWGSFKKPFSGCKAI